MARAPQLVSTAPLGESELAELLARTSRTFALAIPLLEEPLARQVGLAYLMFRIADTFEDAPRWGRDRRREALLAFAEGRDERWRELVAEEPPIDDEGCVALLGRANAVRAAIAAFDPGAAKAIVAHSERTARGMAGFVEQQDAGGAMTLGSLAELRAYAYVVAGIVGELLTELFALAQPSVAQARAALDAEARAFGEGLQLVNILKDAGADAREGRSYLPPGVPRREVMALAREDLARGARYVEVLRTAKASAGVVAFCDLPQRLAVATLDALEAGRSKLDREEVMRIFVAVTTH